jgi:hypothetical protein
MAMCPGVTDTALISEAYGRQLCKEWVEMDKATNELPKQK